MTEPSINFDYDEVFDRLDGVEPEPELDSAELAAVLGSWINAESSKSMSDIDNAVRIGRRAMVVEWTLNPAAFGGISLRELARQYEIHRNTLTRLTGEVSRLLNYRNHAQSHAHNWRAS